MEVFLFELILRQSFEDRNGGRSGRRQPLKNFYLPYGLTALMTAETT